jgi:hypothetical protein
MNNNQYLKEFNKIKPLLKDKYRNLEHLKESLKPILLKLNNPTFFSKYLYASPSQKYGYPSNNYRHNYFVVFTTECINILTKSQDVDEAIKILQVELSWALKIPFTFYAK